MKRLYILLFIILIANFVQAQSSELKTLLTRTIIIPIVSNEIDPAIIYKQYDKVQADSIIISTITRKHETGNKLLPNDLKIYTDKNLLAIAFKNYWWISDNYVFMKEEDMFQVLKSEPHKYTAIYFEGATVTKETTTSYGHNNAKSYTTSKSRDIKAIKFSSYDKIIQSVHLPAYGGYSYADIALSLNRLQYGLNFEIQENSSYTDVKSVKAITNSDLFSRKILLLNKKEINVPLDKIQAIYRIGQVEITDTETIEQAILNQDPRYLCLTNRGSGYNGGIGLLIVDIEKGATCLMAYSTDPLVSEKEFKNFMKQHKIYSKKK